MPFCTYCGQSFTRDEHLERHILTHTNVKPYKCFTCHMSFARRDLLHRHYTVHGKDSSQEPLAGGDGIVPKSAGRTPIACHNCAKTKTKCDKKFPCTRCASRNLTCTARPTRRTPKNPGPQLEDCKAGGSEESSLDSQTDSTSSSPPGDSSVSMSPIAIRPNRSISISQANENADAPMCVSPMEDLTSPFEQAPGLTFADITPLSEYDDYMRSNMSDGSSDPLPSPQYIFDWQQMAVPFSYDQKPDVLMSPAEFDQNGYMDHLEDPSNYMHEFSSEISNHQIYLPTAAEEQNFQLPTSPSADSHPSKSSCHSRHDSVLEPLPLEQVPLEPLSRDPEAVSIARDGWSAFKCNPIIPSSLCPKTARLNLEQLEQNLKNHQGLVTQLPAWEEEYSQDDIIFVAPLQEMARDKLLAITQSFLHKALEIHNDGQPLSPQYPLPGSPYGSNFIILPPARILHSFLRSYTNGFERFYPTISKGIFDPNLLLQGYNDKAVSLLILLMIAQGATISPAFDARELTAGLTETCRISLFDLIEKNIMLASDPVVLHSALLFTVQAAWSGDKWQMDIAMGQRGMYLAMLRHSGRMETQTLQQNPNEQVDTETIWNRWVEQESNSRLVYTWAMVDQDLSLFHDTAPLFSTTEFGEPMPDSDVLWRAKSVSEWAGLFEQAHEAPTSQSSISPRFRPLSLRNLFRHFLDDAIVAKRIELTPLHLRLLLHPLQSMVCQFRQLLSCFSDKTAARRGSKSVSAASTRARLEEVQMLLQRWYGLADKYMKTNRLCPLMQTNLVMFHLISLNAVTNFPEMERLARRDDGERSYQQIHRIHKRCITNAEEAVFHCGQVIRQIRSMPPGLRPPWWAGAVYRATIILWTDSLAHSDAVAQGHGVVPSLETSFAVDTLPPHHPMIGRYLAKSEGTPTLTRRDGSLMPINNPVAVLFYGTDVLEEGVSTRFSDGIRSKLSRLAADESR